MTDSKENQIGVFLVLNADFDTARRRTVEALKSEGFGVLTEIDVQETMRQKLGINYPPHRILGACNPSLAHQALSVAPEVGLLLPCNATVRQLADGRCEVAFIDPLVMLGVIANPALAEVAKTARAKLDRVAAALRSEK
ncbi:MAG: DUF302 domain-containing protein [Chloroflexi bacterium]|nr:DUF302 domain-containing protein [Chloroflexota bacterium]